MISKLKYFEGDTGKKPMLSNFLEHYNYTLYDLYGKSGNRSFSRMKVETGVRQNFEIKDEEVMTKILKNLFHINSRKLIEFAIDVLTRGVKLEGIEFNKEEKLMLGMLHYSFYLEAPVKLGFNSFEEALEVLYEVKRRSSSRAYERSQ